ncbi:serine hydrolase [Streptomyces sp. NPDC006385]|uniref:serine hydrolase n=1 Tax=Streptomyces sp. NPDC006385 TaxID=3156761 RepID=UPI0033A9068C
MADRTPDTSVLDEDDPPTGSSGAGRDPGPGSTATDSGRPSGEPTSSEPTRAEPADEAEESEKPEKSAAEEREESEGPAEAEGREESDAPEEPKDAVGEPAVEAGEVDTGAAPAGAPAPDAEDDADEPLDAEDNAAPDENAEATTQDNSTAPDKSTEPAADDTDTARAQNAEATAEDDETKPDEDTEPALTDTTPATDDTTPDKNTEPAPEDDNPAPAEDSEPAPADELELGKDAPSESSESTRTVALRTPEDVTGAGAGAGADRTMALSVADLPRVEPTAPPAAPQDAQGGQDGRDSKGQSSQAPASQAPATQSRPSPPPPASPIDLLAQLTNTPPPPNTPARTILRRVKIWSPVVALLALAMLVVQVVRPLPEPRLVIDANAASFTVGGGTFSMPWPEKGQAAVMVAGTGAIGTFGKQKPVPTASVAKIMTAYVVLRDHPLKRDEPGPSVTVDARTVQEGKSKDESRIEGLRVGQKFNLQDMLKMLMIPSGNNVARLLARWDTGTKDEAAFVRKMNEAARSLGMKNTTYTDPSGLDEGTVSTAVDQLRLAEAVMKSDSFRAVVAMANADIPGGGRIYNNNALLTEPGLSVRGIKTGSNTPAGGTLSWAAYKTVDGEDRLILGTMMDQHVTGPDPNGANSLQLVQDNSEKVIRAVREALTSATAIRKGQVVGHVDDGLGGRTPVVATRDLKVVGIPGQKLTLTFRDGRADIVGGMRAGTVVGELTLDGVAGAQRVPVALRSDLREPSLGAKLTRIG